MRDDDALAIFWELGSESIGLFCGFYSCGGDDEFRDVLGENCADDVVQCRGHEVRCGDDDCDIGGVVGGR